MGLIRTADQILAEIGQEERDPELDRPLKVPCRKTGRTYRVNSYPVERRSPRPPQFCSLPECDRRHEALGYCDRHYYRFTKYDSPYGKPKPRRSTKDLGPI